jgi:hypothetical protein
VIAEKALICYKCGTATTEAKYQPAVVRDRRSPVRLVVAAALIVVAIAVAFAVYFLHRAG